MIPNGERNNEDDPMNQEDLGLPWIDLSGIKVRKGKIKDPELVLPCKGYSAATNTLGAKLISQVAVARRTGIDKPDLLGIASIEGNNTDVRAVPVRTEGVATVRVHWGIDGTAHVDMTQLLACRRLPIPLGHRAHIPLVEDNAPGAGPSMIIKFSGVYTEPIEASKRKNSPGKAQATDSKTNKGNKAPGNTGSNPAKTSPDEESDANRG